MVLGYRWGGLRRRWLGKRRGEQKSRGGECSEILQFKEDERDQNFLYESEKCGGSGRKDGVHDLSKLGGLSTILRTIDMELDATPGEKSLTHERVSAGLF